MSTNGQPATEWERLHADLQMIREKKAEEMAREETCLRLERSAAQGLRDVIQPVMMHTQRGRMHGWAVMRGMHQAEITLVRIVERVYDGVRGEDEDHYLLTVEIRCGADQLVQYIVDDEEIGRDEVLEAVASIVRHYGILE